MPFHLFAAPNPSGPPAPQKPAVGGRIDPEAAHLEQPAEDDDVRGEVAAVMADLLPWGISVLLHVGLVLVAILAVWATQTILEEEEQIIPVAVLSDNPGAPLSMKQTQKIQEQTSSQKRQISKVKTETVSNTVTKTTDAPKLIGVVGGEAGKSSPFGALTGVGGPFKASFYGTGGNARRIVFVVDASGSMIDTLPFVINELKTSINKLSERQAFAVVFAVGNQRPVSPWPGLRPADSTNRQFVMNWLDAGNVVPQGQTAPLASVKDALQRSPQLVFLLSDNITGQGRYELSQDALIKELLDANRSGTKINTIQFLYPDRLEAIGLEPTLRLLAHKTQGLYKFVDAAELGL